MDCVVGRSGQALTSLLWHAPYLINLNVGWNDMKMGGAGLLVPTALAGPGRLVSLELSFNGLADDVGVSVRIWSTAKCSMA